MMMFGVKPPPVPPVASLVFSEDYEEEDNQEMETEGIEGEEGLTSLSSSSFSSSSSAAVVTLASRLHDPLSQQFQHAVSRKNLLQRDPLTWKCSGCWDSNFPHLSLPSTDSFKDEHALVVPGQEEYSEDEMLEKVEVRVVIDPLEGVTEIFTTAEYTRAPQKTVPLLSSVVDLEEDIAVLEEVVQEVPSVVETNANVEVVSPKEGIEEVVEEAVLHQDIEDTVIEEELEEPETVEEIEAVEEPEVIKAPIVVAVAPMSQEESSKPSKASVSPASRLQDPPVIVKSFDDNSHRREFTLKLTPRVPQRSALNASVDKSSALLLSGSIAVLSAMVLLYFLRRLLVGSSTDSHIEQKTAVLLFEEEHVPSVAVEEVQEKEEIVVIENVQEEEKLSISTVPSVEEEEAVVVPQPETIEIVEQVIELPTSTKMQEEEVMELLRASPEVLMWDVYDHRTSPTELANPLLDSPLQPQQDELAQPISEEAVDHDPHLEEQQVEVEYYDVYEDKEAEAGRVKVFQTTPLRSSNKASSASQPSTPMTPSFSMRLKLHEEAVANEQMELESSIASSMDDSVDLIEANAALTPKDDDEQSDDEDSVGHTTVSSITMYSNPQIVFVPMTNTVIAPVNVKKAANKNQIAEDIPKEISVTPKSARELKASYSQQALPESSPMRSNSDAIRPLVNPDSFNSFNDLPRRFPVKSPARESQRLQKQFGIQCPVAVRSMLTPKRESSSSLIMTSPAASVVPKSPMYSQQSIQQEEVSVSAVKLFPVTEDVVSSVAVDVPAAVPSSVIVSEVPSLPVSQEIKAAPASPSSPSGNGITISKQTGNKIADILNRRKAMDLASLGSSQCGSPDDDNESVSSNDDNQSVSSSSSSPRVERARLLLSTPSGSNFGSAANSSFNTPSRSIFGNAPRSANTNNMVYYSPSSLLRPTPPRATNNANNKTTSTMTPSHSSTTTSSLSPSKSSASIAKAKDMR